MKNQKPETHVADQSHATGAVNNGGQATSGKEVFVTHVKGSKAARAQEIFNEIGRTQPRKVVISRFVSEVELSPSGASTYYQNMKKNAGMVNRRELVTTAVPQGGHAPTAQEAATSTAPSAKK